MKFGFYDRFDDLVTQRVFKIWCNRRNENPFFFDFNKLCTEACGKPFVEEMRAYKPVANDVQQVQKVREEAEAAAARAEQEAAGKGSKGKQKGGSKAGASSSSSKQQASTPASSRPAAQSTPGLPRGSKRKERASASPPPVSPKKMAVRRSKSFAPARQTPAEAPASATRPDARSKSVRHRREEEQTVTPIVSVRPPGW